MFYLKVFTLFYFSQILFDKLTSVTKKTWTKRSSVKVRHYSRNYFFKLTFLSKKQTNEFDITTMIYTSGRLVFVCFLEEIEDTKKTLRN